MATEQLIVRPAPVRNEARQAVPVRLPEHLEEPEDVRLPGAVRP